MDVSWSRQRSGPLGIPQPRGAIRWMVEAVAMLFKPGAVPQLFVMSLFGNHVRMQLLRPEVLTWLKKPDS